MPCLTAGKSVVKLILIMHNKLRIILLSVLFFASISVAEAQAKRYKVIISDIQDNYSRGWFSHFNDSMLFMYPLYAYRDSAMLKSYSYRDIHKISFFREGKMKRNVLWGMLIGAAIGTPSGYAASGEDTEGIYTGAAFGIISGAIVGAVIGLTPSKNFGVQGDPGRFRRFQMNLNLK